MNPNNRKASRPTMRTDRPAESASTQIAAALGYTVVVVTSAMVVLGSFTDDFGLGPAALACLPVSAACLAAIKRKKRS
jgi:hypothetical protein